MTPIRVIKSCIILFVAVVLFGCSSGGSNCKVIVPIQILANNLFESNITQAGGSTSILVKLARSTAVKQQIFVHFNPDFANAFNVQSTPSTCFLESTGDNCSFVVTTTESTILGQYQLTFETNNSSLFQESSVDLVVIPPRSFYFAHNGVNAPYHKTWTPSLKTLLPQDLLTQPIVEVFYNT